jgi:hypothetical protein
MRWAYLLLKWQTRLACWWPLNIERHSRIRLLIRFSGKLGRQSISAELLQPAELVSGVICQVAVEPELAALLANFLYSNEGAQSLDAPYEV